MVDKNNSHKRNLFIYGLYCKIITSEKHYTTMQVRYRRLAAYWLLVVFAAIGMVFSTDESAIPFNQLISTMVAGLIGIVGNCYIWYEDLYSLERFLNLNPLEAFKLEEKYKWLPQIHHQFVFYSHKLMLNNKILFYVGSNSILCLVIMLAFFLYFINIHLWIAILGILMFLIIFIFCSRILFVKTYKNELSVLKEFTND